MHMSGTAYLRFYEELNDFLPDEKRKRRFEYMLEGGLTVGGILLRLGVPSTRVEIILAGGDSVGLSHVARDGEYISFYPVFESLDVGALLRLREAPLRNLCFLAAVGLHGLVRYLRLCGFDTMDLPGGDPDELACRAELEGRIILFKEGSLRLPEWSLRAWRIRAAKPRRQLIELIEDLSLTSSIVPMGRCLRCNGLMADAADDRQPPTAETLRCQSCGQVYGPLHLRRSRLLLNSLTPRSS